MTAILRAVVVVAALQTSPYFSLITRVDGAFVPSNHLKRADAETSQEPVLGAPAASTSLASPNLASGPNTPDGKCGKDNGNKVCGDWPQGSCCSQYGWCGDR